MSVNFDAAFNALMGVEKGFWNDPVGGPTMYGVTESVARAHGYAGDMRALPLDLAKNIAKSEYWDKFQCDQFDPAIGYQVFDTAYNGGHPIQWLQKAVGIAQDGSVGSMTIAAIRKTDTAVVIARFNAYRLQYMASLTNWTGNSRGWALRIAGNLIAGVEQ